jgi:hypothetical protein
MGYAVEKDRHMKFVSIENEKADVEMVIDGEKFEININPKEEESFSFAGNVEDKGDFLILHFTDVIDERRDYTVNKVLGHTENRLKILDQNTVQIDKDITELVIWDVRCHIPDHMPKVTPKSKR